MAETNRQTAVTLEGLRAASALIATKAEVKKQIEEAALTSGGVAFATEEEVLALFAEPES